MASPWLGASLKRTLREITVGNTLAPNAFRASSTTCRASLVRGSYIVRTIPRSSSAGLSEARTSSIVSRICASPSSA